MRINKRLHLVIPVTREDGTVLYAHSTPISEEIFDAHFLVIAKTFSAIYAEGLGPLAGPRVADKILRRVARNLGEWDKSDGTPGPAQGLVAEMRRLTNVLAPGAKGWEMRQFEEALSAQLIDATDASEIEAALTFFTVASAMHRRVDLKEILEAAAGLWGARIEYLNCTEYLNSLRTSTEAASTGATTAA